MLTFLCSCESACEGENAKRTFMQVTIYLFLTFGGVSGR
jgi:hypothetical protein